MVPSVCVFFFWPFCTLYMSELREGMGKTTWGHGACVFGVVSALDWGAELLLLGVPLSGGRVMC